MHYVITDAGNNVVQSYTYDSFGMPTPSTNFHNSYLYTGREFTHLLRHQGFGNIRDNQETVFTPPT